MSSKYAGSNERDRDNGGNRLYQYRRKIGDERKWTESMRSNANCHDNTILRPTTATVIVIKQLRVNDSDWKVLVKYVHERNQKGKGGIGREK